MDLILGVDVGGTTISAGLVSPSGEIVKQVQVPTHQGGSGSALTTLLTLLDRLLAEASGEGVRVLGIGAGVPGAVDAAGGVVGMDVQNVPELAGVPLAAELGRVASLPAYIDNDVNVLALGEWRFGAGRGARSLVLLAIGTGVGGGIILDGRLLRGASGYGGELGHVSINFDGRPCFCGGRGCLKTYVSGPDIATEARQRVKGQRDSLLSALAGGDPDGITATHVFRAAAEGDPLAAALVDEVCQALGAGLAAVVNGLNPEVLLVTGGVAESLGQLEGTILRWAGRYAFARALAATRISIIPAEKRATVLGGAALFLYETERSALG
jgi:glucokinase